MTAGHRFVRHARAVARLAALVAFTSALYAVLAPARLVLGPESPKALALRRRIMRTWARGVAMLLGMNVEVAGSPPKPPFLLVSNHLGYIDILTLAATVDCVFVAKSDLASWPFVGTLCRVADVMFVDRASRRDVVRVNALIEGALRRGEGVILFPEGTSTQGSTVCEFKSSLLDYPAREGIPIRIATLTYRTSPPDPPAHLSVCWWGDMTFPDHFFALLGMRGFKACITYGEEPIESRDRKQLAKRLWEGVLAVFEPVVTVQGAGAAGTSEEGRVGDVYGKLAS